jgi:hypothetical protein
VRGVKGVRGVLKSSTGGVKSVVGSTGRKLNSIILNGGKNKTRRNKNRNKNKNKTNKNKKNKTNKNKNKKNKNRD